MSESLEFAEETQPAQRAERSAPPVSPLDAADPEVALVAAVCGDPTGATWARVSSAPAEAFMNLEARGIWRALQIGTPIDDPGRMIADCGLSMRRYVEWSGLDTIGTFADMHLRQVLAAYQTRRLQEIAMSIVQHPEIQAAERAKQMADLAGLEDQASTAIYGRAYDASVRLEKPEPIYQIAGTTICTPGNITTLYAQSKAGKSSFLAAMMASSMTTPTSGHDTLGVTGPNYAKHAVIYIDTEMSPYDFQNLIDSALRRVGLKEPPPWFIAYTMTGVGAPECRTQVDRLLRLGKKLHGGVHSLFIDGVGDLVVNPNDEAECFPLVTKLQGQAIAYHTSIITVLHQNPGSDVKGRGHLGSQLERKSESNLTMEKTGNVTRVWATKQRGKMIMKDNAPAFEWSDEREMHVTCEADPDEPKKNRGGRPKKYEFHTFVPAFPKAGEKAMPPAEIFRYARGIAPIPETTFREMLAEADRDGMLIRTKDERRGFVYTLR